MRSFDEWNDDLPDDGSQPDLPFNGSAPAASSEESETAKPALGRGPLEELFDAFARGQESGAGPDARQEQEPEVVQASQPSSQAIVETEVVSLPVALVLKPRESVALVSIPAASSPEPSAADAFAWSRPRPLDVAPLEAALDEAVEPTVILPAAPAIEVKAVEEKAVEEAAPFAPVTPSPVVPAVADLKPLVAEPVVVKAAIVESSVEELPGAESPVVAPPVIAPPVIAPRVAAPVPPPPAPIVAPVMKAPIPVPVPAPVVPAAIVKPPITIKIKETPKVEPPPRAPERVAHVPEPVLAAEPARSRGMGRYLAAAAAIIVIIGAIGIPMGKLWATRQQEGAIVTPAPQPRVTPAQPREKRAEPVSAAAPQPAPVVAPIAQHLVTAPAASSATAVLAPRPKPSVTAPPQPIATLPTPAVAPPTVAVLPATEVSEPVPVIPAPIAALPAPEPPAPTPSAEAPAPIGPFFEMAQVDRAPRVASRVEPQLSAGAQPKANDIALVRVLVSQAGHPVLVRMLRPSKGGLAADDAVIEAVKKWTFRPAVKKGEAVTCWLHVAVPLSGAR